MTCEITGCSSNLRLAGCKMQALFCTNEEEGVNSIMFIGIEVLFAVEDLQKGI